MRILVMCLAIAALLGATSAAAQSRLFVTSGNQFVEVSKVDGSTIGAAISTGAVTIVGMTNRFTDHQMFGVNSANNHLVSILPVGSPLTSVVVTDIGALGFPITDLAFNGQFPPAGPPNILLGYNPTNASMYTINTTTGAATLLGATGVAAPSAGGGISIGNSNNIFLQAEKDNGPSRIVNQTTGAATTAATLTGSTCQVAAAAGCPILASDADPTPAPGENPFYVMSQGDAAGGGVYIGSIGGPGATLTRINGPNTHTANAMSFYTPPPATPTLGEWAMLCLAILIGGLGFAALARRSTRTQISSLT